MTSASISPFSHRHAIRHRVNRFSNSVLGILTSDSSVVNKRLVSYRPITSTVSRIIVYLITVSVICIMLSDINDMYHQLRPAGLRFTRHIAENYNATKAIDFLDSLGDDAPYSVSDYPLVLVNESEPFPRIPSLLDEQDEEQQPPAGSEKDMQTSKTQQQQLEQELEQKPKRTPAFSPASKPVHDQSVSIVDMPESEDEVYHFDGKATAIESGEKNAIKEGTGVSKEAGGVKSNNRAPAARLIVLTMNRARSLRRLLESLAGAVYSGDEVDLEIWIDRTEGAPSVDLNVLNVSRNATWSHGTKTIHKRKQNAGLYQQWIYTWDLSDSSSDDSEFAVILEDDLQVSPQFYQWLKEARAAYAGDEDVAALTLQRPTLRPRQRKGVASGPLNISKTHTVFKYRLLGTWGFAPLPAKWAEFRRWFEQQRNKGRKPYVDDLVTTQWYKNQEVDGFAPTMWSQWWIRFVEDRNYFTITPNLRDGSTLSANWKEPGLHFSSDKAKADFPVYQGDGKDFDIPEKPILVDWDGLIIPNRTAHSV